MKQGKVWGQTAEIFHKNNVSVNRIEAKKGHCCSKHKHQHKYNIFFVEKGQLLIEDWQQDYKLVDKTILNAGESCEIPPGHYHRFTALEDTVAYEIYYLTLENKDIVREDCGKRL